MPWRLALLLGLVQAQEWPPCPLRGCLPCPANAEGRPNCTCLEGYTTHGRPGEPEQREELAWDTLRGWLSDCLPVPCGAAVQPPAAAPVSREDLLPKAFSETARFLCNDGYEVESLGGSWDSATVEAESGNASGADPGVGLPSSRLVMLRCGSRGDFLNVTGVTCVPVCGDARLVSTDHLPIYEEPEQCDDGNRNSGDGCDSRCQVESGFVCVGGDPSGPDRCGEATASAESVILLAVTGYRPPSTAEVASATRWALAKALDSPRRDLEVLEVVTGESSTTPPASTTSANGTASVGELHGYRTAMQVRFRIKISDTQVLSQARIQAALGAPQIFGPQLVVAYMRHTTLQDLYVTVVEVRSPTMMGVDDSIQGEILDFNDYLVLVLTVVLSGMSYACVFSVLGPTIYWCLFTARRRYRIGGYTQHIPEEMQKGSASGLCDWYKTSKATCCMLPFFLPSRLAYTWDTVGLIPYWKGVRQALTCCGLYAFGCWPCGAFIAGSKRSDLKDVLGLGDGVKSNIEVEDYVSYLFCPCCSLVQEATHVDRVYQAVRLAVRAEEEKAAKAPRQEEEEEDEENQNVEAPTLQSMFDEGINAALDTAVGAFD